MNSWADLTSASCLEAAALIIFDRSTSMIKRGELYSALHTADNKGGKLGTFMTGRNAALRTFESSKGFKVEGAGIAQKLTEINNAKWEYLPLLVCLNLTCKYDKVYANMKNSLSVQQ
jgi:hypothetical protein